jgi:cytochrome c oxidase subunit 2
MLSKVHVVPGESYDAWVAGPSTAPPTEGGAAPARPAPPADPAARGKLLAADKGCTTCHSEDGSALVGPTLKGLWGRIETLEGGKKVRVDEPYVLRSIKTPGAELVKGYPDAMPQLPLTDAEIGDLIAWLQTLK